MFFTSTVLNQMAITVFLQSRIDNNLMLLVFIISFFHISGTPARIRSRWLFLLWFTVQGHCGVVILRSFYLWRFVMSLLNFDFFIFSHSLIMQGLSRTRINKIRNSISFSL